MWICDTELLELGKILTQVIKQGCTLADLVHLGNGRGPWYWRKYYYGLSTKRAQTLLKLLRLFGPERWKHCEDPSEVVGIVIRAQALSVCGPYWNCSGYYYSTILIACLRALTIWQVMDFCTRLWSCKNGCVVPPMDIKKSPCKSVFFTYNHGNWYTYVSCWLFRFEFSLAVSKRTKLSETICWIIFILAEPILNIVMMFNCRGNEILLGGVAVAVQRISMKWHCSHFLYLIQSSPHFWR